MVLLWSRRSDHSIYPRQTTCLICRRCCVYGLPSISITVIGAMPVAFNGPRLPNDCQRSRSPGDSGRCSASRRAARRPSSSLKRSSHIAGSSHPADPARPARRSCSPSAHECLHLAATETGHRESCSALAARNSQACCAGDQAVQY